MKSVQKNSKEIRNQYLTGERALFQGHDLQIIDTIFADGESPLKESHDIELLGCMFKWKYPLWYAQNTTVTKSTWFEIDSVMNPTGGVIRAESIGELIIDRDKIDPAKTTIVCNQEACSAQPRTFRAVAV